MMRLNKILKSTIKFLLAFLLICTLALMLKDWDASNRIYRKKYRKKIHIVESLQYSDSEDWSQLKTHFKLMSKTSKKHISLVSYCTEVPNSVRGPIQIIQPAENFNIQSNDSIKMSQNYVQINGKWQPNDCKARHRVAIIIPYKDRLNNLKYFLNHMHSFLQKQELEYQIFVVEQSNDHLFNKGVLMNAGFLEIMSLANKKNDLDFIDFTHTQTFPFDCVIFHDVDLLPQDDRIMYSCPSNRPRHLSVGIDKYRYKLTYFKLIGGVLNFKLQHFIKANGYSNEYWGWGGEDDDMEARLRAEKIGFERPHVKIAHYTMIKHNPRFKNPQRKNLLKQARKRYQKDGLNSVEYILTNYVDYKYYTHLYVDVGDPPAYILKLLKSDLNKTTTSITTNFIVSK